MRVPREQVGATQVEECPDQAAHLRSPTPPPRPIRMVLHQEEDHQGNHQPKICEQVAPVEGVIRRLSMGVTSPVGSAPASPIEQENLLGKASRSRAADILAIFRQRYLVDRRLLPALITFSRSDVNDESLNRILYF
jgi:hypothetical protein